MCLLDKQQVKLIEADVKQASITLSHLADDLIDHICCEVEILMDDGQDFNQAYKTVKTQTGISVLKKIQDDTQFLIDKNYRLMKTSMKIIGNIALALVMFGTVFKIMHWPGASILLSFGFLTTILAFFPIAVYVNYKKVSEKKNLWLHIATLFGGITFMLGVAFKIQHWPGASLLLLAGYISLLFAVLPIILFSRIKKATDKKDKRISIVGFIALIIFGLSSMFKLFHWPGASILMIIGAFLLISIFLPLFTWRRIQQEGKITGQFIYTIIISMFFVLFTSLMALNVSKKHLANFIDHHKNENIIASYLNQKNAQSFTKAGFINDSLINKHQLQNIKQQADHLCEFITQIQTSLIQNVEHNNNSGSDLLMNQPERIIKKDNKDDVFSLLIGKYDNGDAYQLKQQVNQFKILIGDIFNREETFKQKINTLIDISDKSKYGALVSWERYHFQNSTLIGSLAYLNELKAQIRTIESMSIAQLTQSVNH